MTIFHPNNRILATGCCYRSSLRRCSLRRWKLVCVLITSPQNGHGANLPFPSTASPLFACRTGNCVLGKSRGRSPCRPAVDSNAAGRHAHCPKINHTFIRGRELLDLSVDSQLESDPDHNIWWVIVNNSSIYCGHQPTKRVETIDKSRRGSSFRGLWR